MSDTDKAMLSAWRDYAFSVWYQPRDGEAQPEAFKAGFDAGRLAALEEAQSRDRENRAIGWDEGWDRGVEYERWGESVSTANPHRGDRT